MNVIETLKTFEQNAVSQKWNILNIFKHIGELDKLYSENLDYKININGILGNIASDIKNIDLLNHAIKRQNDLLNDFPIDKMKGKGCYDIGNLIHSKFNILYDHPPKIKFIIKSTIYQEAIQKYLLVDKTNMTEYLMATTNLANIYDQCGRNFEAISEYKRAIKIDKSFGMANLNLGQALLYYNNISKTTPTLDYLLLKKVYLLLKSGLKDRRLKEIGGERAINHFNELYISISNKLSSQKIQKRFKPKTNNYLNFVSKHNLFLNFYFGFIINQESVKDNIFPPFIANISKFTEVDFNRIYGTMGKKVYTATKFYNEIIEEYATSRYLYYSVISKNKISVYDNHTQYIDTLDYTYHSIENGILKNVYVKLYNIIEKCAKLVSIYFNIPIKEYKYIRFEEIYLSKRIFKIILKSNNYQLLAFILLLKDFSSDFRYDSFRLKRNQITHHYLDFQDGNNFNSDGKYRLDISKFEEEILNLFVVTKSAILYLYLSIDTDSELKCKKHEIGNMEAIFQNTNLFKKIRNGG